MLVGHFAVGLTAKRIEPAISAGTLVLASMLADLLWCILYVRWNRACAIQARHRDSQLFRGLRYCRKPQPVDGRALGDLAGNGLLSEAAQPAWSMGHLRSSSEPLAS